MKKYLTLILVSMISLVLAACNSDKNSAADSKKETESNAIDVYTTVYPLQYFTERIGGEYVNVQSIYPPGTNEHTFEPTQKDMMALADSDLFFYIGLGLEGFVEKSKTTLAKENVKLVATADNVSEEKLHISTGNTHEHEEDGHHQDQDAHVWLSPVISQDLALAIKDELITELPEQEELFTANYEALIEELQALHEDFEAMAASTSSKTFFVSHAAFGYIAGHYGFSQVPVAGLNSQSEPSQKELTKIVDLAKKEKIDYIFFEQNVSSNLATVIQNEVGAKSLILHNLSVLTPENIKNNETYFTLMKKNMDNLKTALQ